MAWREESNGNSTVPLDHRIDHETGGNDESTLSVEFQSHLLVPVFD
jgi:hypothetical protein